MIEQTGRAQPTPDGRPRSEQSLGLLVAATVLALGQLILFAVWAHDVSGFTVGVTRFASTAPARDAILLAEAEVICVAVAAAVFAIRRYRGSGQRDGFPYACLVALLVLSVLSAVQRPYSSHDARHLFSLAAAERSIAISCVNLTIILIFTIWSFGRRRRTDRRGPKTV